jgi:hypothetical protein
MHMKRSPGGTKDILSEKIPTTLQENPLNSQMRLPWVQYDNLPAEILPQLHVLTRERAQALIEQLDRWMAAHDRDVTPSVEGTGRKRAMVGIYYFEDDVREEE